MSSVTTNRHIDLEALPFGASMRSQDDEHTVTADVSEATLRAAIEDAQSTPRVTPLTAANTDARLDRLLAALAEVTTLAEVRAAAYE